MELNDPGTLFDDFPPITIEEWEEKIRKDLKGADYVKTLIWETPEGFPVNPYYTEKDLTGLDYLKSLPGEFPFLRGFRRDGNNWQIRQDIQSIKVEEANTIAKDAIRGGVQAIGFNAREITTHQQIRKLLENIDLTQVTIHFSGSRSYPLTAELLNYEVDRQEIDPKLLKGSINFDPFSYLLTHGDFYVSLANNMDEAKYLLNTLQKKMPQYKVLAINGSRFQNAGSTLVQELAFSLASGNEYLAGLTERGFSPDELASRMSFTFALGSNYFLEIAKLRAARLLWSKIVDQYQPEDPSTCRMDIHCVTATWNKSIFDPYVNMLRTTTEGMSGVLGNADTISILPFDRPFHPADAFSDRIARNQQLIFKEESYLDKVSDPTAGAYFIESMTDSFASHAWELFKEVEERGGMVESIKQNFIQDAVAKSRAQKEKDVARRKVLLLGTNQYPGLSEKMLDKVTTEKPVTNETPSTYKKMLPFRAAEPFETLRLDTERYIASGGKAPAVFLFTMGNLAKLRARAGFATNFFGCAGYEIYDNPGFKTVEAGVKAAITSEAEIVVICSSDDDYKQIVPEITARLKHLRSSLVVVVAGYPTEIIEELKQGGVDGFIHVKSNLLEELRSFHHRLGIK